jgi:hypothetical protein
MNELNEKDHAKLISIVNKRLESEGNPKEIGYSRVYIKNATAGLLDFYERNQNEINAEVVLVERTEDEPRAASARNNNGFYQHTLLVFSMDYFVATYFSGTFNLIEVPKALIKRVNNVYGENH